MSAWAVVVHPLSDQPNLLLEYLHKRTHSVKICTCIGLISRLDLKVENQTSLMSCINPSFDGNDVQSEEWGNQNIFSNQPSEHMFSQQDAISNICKYSSWYYLNIFVSYNDLFTQMCIILICVYFFISHSAQPPDLQNQKWGNETWLQKLIVRGIKK